MRKLSLIRPSTRAFWREGQRIPGYSLFDRLHGYVYARWPYLYISVGTGEHRLSPLINRVVAILGRLGLLWSEEKKPGQPTLADTYHGKVVPLEAAAQLVTINQDIRITDLERIIPYSRARDIIMQDPQHIVVLDCPCRAARAHPCLPLDVCLIIGEPFASFVAEHHPRRARWINAQEAVDILRAEDERGHVHHAFFKDAMLGRFYAICNCCSCCCGAMQAHQFGVPMLASSGYLCQADDSLCIGCGECVEQCQFGALALHDGHIAVDGARCMGCGVCVSRCVQGALALQLDASRGEPLVIQELMQNLS